jgi:hypothetical protein
VCNQRSDQTVLSVRHRFPLIAAIRGSTSDVGESDHEAAVFIGGQSEGVSVAHDAVFSPELGRINAEVPAHLPEQTFADLLLEILDRGPSGSKVHDSMAAATPARIHFETDAAPAGKPA